MLTSQSREILERFQVRKSSREKREFRAWLRGELEAAGWTTAEEGAFFSGTNVIAGDPDRARVLFTAHYDTQAVLPFPNFITPRSLGWYLAYQLVLVAGMFALAALVTAAVVLAPALLDVPAAVCSMVGSLTWMAALVFMLWWLLFGKANRHTANDNTSGVVTLAEIALTLPEALRDKVCIVFFDNEERGMLGSAHFASRHKEAKKNALVLNFDCVSDGDSLQFFPTKALKRDGAALDALRAAFPGGAGKEVEVVTGFGFYPSDNASFKRACGVCALKHKRGLGYYMDRIHTSRDTCFDEANIALLVRGSTALSEELGQS